MSSTTSHSISLVKQAVTEAQAGKRTFHIHLSIKPIEQQMHESAVEAGECLALRGGSAITTSADVHQPQRGGV